MSRLLSVLVTALLVSASFTASAYVLDQVVEKTLPGGGSSSITESRDLGQTFTPGFSEILAFIVIEFAEMNTPGAVDLSITETVSGVPSLDPGDVLATVTTPGVDLVVGSNRFIFEPQNVWLEEGEMYAFVMEAAEPATWVQWTYERGGPYTRGALWQHFGYGQDPPEWRGGADGNDVLFRTYMVPEPGLHCLLGFGAVGFLRRRG